MAGTETGSQASSNDTVMGFKIPSIASISMEQPWSWLAAGYRDMWQAPSVSLTYGAIFSIAAIALTWGLTIFGMQAMVLSLAGGFLLLGPMLAIGLYETSRRVESGEQVSLGTALSAYANAKGQLAFMGVILLVLYLAWVELALILFMLFMGPIDFPPVEQFIPTLLFTPNGLSLLVVGSIVGGILAATAYAISVVSIPLMLVEEVDAITAVLTSIKACLKNWQALALWAILIAACIALGIVTLGIGLIFAFPLIGHASWHAFKDIIPNPASR